MICWYNIIYGWVTRVRMWLVYWLRRPVWSSDRPKLSRFLMTSCAIGNLQYGRFSIFGYLVKHLAGDKEHWYGSSFIFWKSVSEHLFLFFDCSKPAYKMSPANKKNLPTNGMMIGNSFQTQPVGKSYYPILAGPGYFPVRVNLFILSPFWRGYQATCFHMSLAGEFPMRDTVAIKKRLGALGVCS